MRKFSIERPLSKILEKLHKRNPVTYEAILDKIQEIVNSKEVTRYKNLRSPMQHLKRINIDKSFVLIFSIDEIKKNIVIENYDHHDNVYR